MSDQRAILPITASQELLDAARDIARVYPSVQYDHKIYLDPNDEQFEQKNTERYRATYAAFKYAVASVLRPRFIVEIGIGCGTSALAFAAALNEVHYIVIDSGEWSKRLGKPFLEAVELNLMRMQVSHEIIHEDSQKLDRFPECHLIHIDGDHSFEAVRHDVVAAWNSRAQWILCDDAKDSAVVAGIFHALKFDLKRGSVDWAYFPQTWSGDILIRTDHKARS